MKRRLGLDWTASGPLRPSGYETTEPDWASTDILLSTYLLLAIRQARNRLWTTREGARNAWITYNRDDC